MVDEPANVFYSLMNNGAFSLHSGKILPVGIYGFQLVLKPYMNNQNGFRWVTDILNKGQWLISNQHTASNGDEIFLLEPSQMAKPAMGRLLYHVTPKPNVNGILTNGIQPRKGGGTWLGRTYPPRSHHALTLWDALCFLDTLHSKAPSTGGPGILKPADLNNFEILEFAPPTGIDFWIDAWMTGACWTDSLIPNGIISISSQWQQRYQAVATWR